MKCDSTQLALTGTKSTISNIEGRIFNGRSRIPAVFYAGVDTEELLVASEYEAAALRWVVCEIDNLLNFSPAK
ncbi:hypothetical protein GEV33_010952 [Tenebrio molitor]|uniref:Uncharacterized protein n=1 Tax=Tenebrio molitor TaxID=7067 RepID=A0A8J6L5Q7_TENMO|nr:hypothetical protein GEV33_010952 [Tenebrio molitor]